MNKFKFVIPFLLLSNGLFAWGFYGHKMVNRLAVFSLPPEMFSFYKANIDYLTENLLFTLEFNNLIQVSVISNWISAFCELVVSYGIISYG